MSHASKNSMDDLYLNAANFLDENAALVQAASITLVEAGKTPSHINMHNADLATATVERGIGELHIDSKPSQGQHIIPPNKITG